MIPLAGLLFSGATLTERDDLPPGTGLLGRPVWGPAAMLADLELRLGLPAPRAAQGVRLQRWSRRLAEVAERGPRFYSASYEVDPVGTASALLAWRDTLIDAGWGGEAIAGGGSRLETFVELEAELDGKLPPGPPERLQRVEAALARSRVRPWEALDLAEPIAAWPGRWRRVFALLEERGTSARTVDASAGLSPAPAESDLGRLQASLSGMAVEPGLRGDGSLLLLRAETSWELAHAVAALLRGSPGERSVVLRGGDARALDAAMAALGLPSLGLDSRSVWRPALQLLPLAVELGFAPRDPYRVLELLTLPLGPFAGWVGRRLARALSEAPGIGGRPWRQAKEAVAKRIEAPAEAAERLERIAEWLEGPAQDAEVGAPRSALLEIATRVAGWLEKRIAQAAIAEAAEEAPARDGTGARDRETLGAALAQARSFHDALAHEPRQVLDLVAARQLLEEVSLGPSALELATEQAGRIDAVDGPAGLRASRELVLWWHCVDGTQGGFALDPFRQSERRALEEAGVALPDARALLSAEATAFRGVVLAARRRLVLVIPGTAAGTRLDPHPIWDEIAARLRANPADVARITLGTGAVLGGTGAAGQLPRLDTCDLPPLRLPEARPAWNVDPGRLGASHYSATSLEDLVGCPLRWVLRHRAGLSGSRSAAIPRGPLLNGRLGHRLVEELYLAGALGEPATASGMARELLERLVEEEAAVLLRPGMTFELSQLREQLVRAIERLTELLARARLSVAGVEQAASADFRGRKLEGRLDLLLSDAEGRDVVLDLKWGRKTYRDKLEQGLAVQLAVYTTARRLERGAATLPAAGYFSLSRGELLTTEREVFGDVRALAGPPLAVTWERLERTLTAVEGVLARGVAPVTGVRTALPLLEHAGIEPRERATHLQPAPPCDYCDHGTICGRAWEGLT